ncbi:MAG: DUF3800 domain-containing protein [Planctomycetes bacterium]|nr:DUF3800 domain-containing protein [Planctomycetota bacterium]
MIARTRHHLYIDESGTHDMKHVDPNWPVFVLVGLLVGETYYAKTLVPRVKQLKRCHALPLDAVLHSRDIRRWEGPFGFLKDPVRRQAFYEDLNVLYGSLRVRLYVVIIRKARLARGYIFVPNPYDVSLGQLLSLVCGPPGTPGPWRPNVVKIVAEKRGKLEDKQLHVEYQLFRKHGLPSYGAPNVQPRRPSTVSRVFPERIDFVRKSRAVSGLELADLAAYPIGRAFVNQDWENPAYLALAPKIRALLPFP